MLTYPGTVAVPAAVLGARRLVIVDLSAHARIPMGTPDRRIWVTYNGDIYNFAELQADLQAREHRFQTQARVPSLCGHGPYLLARGRFASSTAARLLGAGDLPLWVSTAASTSTARR